MKFDNIPSIGLYLRFLEDKTLSFSYYNMMAKFAKSFFPDMNYNNIEHGKRYEVMFPKGSICVIENMQLKNTPRIKLNFPKFDNRKALGLGKGGGVWLDMYSFEQIEFEKV